MNHRANLLRPAILALVAAAFLAAHPMGNSSVSHYTRFVATSERLEMVYALDLAETPTSELLREWKLQRTSPRAELQAKALDQARTWLSAVSLKINGTPFTPTVESVDLAIRDGAANIPTIRITAKAFVPSPPGRLTYEDLNYPQQPGWKEIVMTANSGAALSMASHTGKDISKALTEYPSDPAVAPPQELRAEFQWSVTSPPGTAPKVDVLSQLLSRQDLGLAAMLLAIAAAFGFGAMHALSPGHGKTIVAAYLVGSRGTVKHALFLGAMVTFTHTVSVFLLGLGTLFLSRYIVADKIYPILGALSGLTIVIIGATLFYKRLGKLVARYAHHHHHGHGHHDHHHHDHDHSHAEQHVHAHANDQEHGDAKVHSHEPKVALAKANGHSHDDHHQHDHSHSHSHDHDHDHDHHHGPGGHTHVPEGEVTFASLMGLAVSGGLVPCPSALVLLLTAIALGRIGFGLVLLTSFSLGLALVLIAIGCLVLYAKHLLPDTPRVQRSAFFVMMPVISAAVITCVGLFMTLVALGVVKTSWTI